MVRLNYLTEVTNVKFIVFLIQFFNYLLFH